MMLTTCEEGSRGGEAAWVSGKECKAKGTFTIMLSLTRLQSEGSKAKSN